MIGRLRTLSLAQPSLAEGTAYIIIAHTRDNHVTCHAHFTGISAPLIYCTLKARD